MSDQSRPNIVFILGDNVGWGDIGCYGGLAPTPRIDNLAAQGLRFKNYNVEAQFTPTRSSILTGRLPNRTGNCSDATAWAGSLRAGSLGIHDWRAVLEHWLCDGGVRQVARRRHRRAAPTDQGFDEWFGIRNTSDESGYSSYARPRLVATYAREFTSFVLD